MALTSFTTVILTPLGKDRHERFGFNRPHSIVSGTLYQSNTGLSIAEIATRSGLFESVVKQSVEILKKNGLVKVLSPENSDGNSNVQRLSL